MTDPLSRSLRWLGIATATLYLIGIAVSAGFWFYAQEQRRAGEQAHRALCTLRADLDRRIVSSQVFLRDHPEGLAGIPASTIRQSIRDQQKTAAALRDLSTC